MDLNTIQQDTFRQAIVHSIELTSGETTSVVTIYNSSEINFEELVSRMTQGLSRCEKVKSVKTDVGGIKTGKFKSSISYNKIEFTRLNNTWLPPEPESFNLNRQTF